MGREAKRCARGAPVAWTEHGEVHPVRDHAGLAHALREHRLLHSLHQPRARRRDAEAAAGVDLPLAAPIVRGRVAPGGGVDVQVGAPATTGAPPFTVERMGAVAAQQPRVVKRQDQRNLGAERRERTQVEVPAVEVVRVNDVGPLGGECQEAPRSREMEILSAGVVVEGPRRVRYDSRHPSGCRRERARAVSPKPVGDLEPETRPGGPLFGVRHGQDVDVVAVLLADREPRVVPAPSVRRKEVPRDLLRAAADVGGAHLQDAQAFLWSGHPGCATLDATP